MNEFNIEFAGTISHAVRFAETELFPTATAIAVVVVDMRTLSVVATAES